MTKVQAPQEHPGSLDALVERTDGTEVLVVVNNRGLDSEVTRDGLPLTGEQLSAIGRTPGLSL